MRKVLKDNAEAIWKLMLSTSLAQAARTKEKTLSPQYKDFTQVFDELSVGVFPPQQHFDHAIDLKETFVPKVIKAYPLNPKGMDTCKEIIDEHLKSGNFQKSQSPQASLFCFVQKKDVSLCPCQDYWYLNEHTVKNPHPLLLILTIIDKLKEAKFSSKMYV